MAERNSQSSTRGESGSHHRLPETANRDCTTQPRHTRVLRTGAGSPAGRVDARAGAGRPVESGVITTARSPSQHRRSSPPDDRPGPATSRTAVRLRDRVLAPRAGERPGSGARGGPGAAGQAGHGRHVYSLGSRRGAGLRQTGPGNRAGTAPGQRKVHREPVRLAGASTSTAWDRRGSGPGASWPPIS